MRNEHIDLVMKYGYNHTHIFFLPKMEEGTRPLREGDIIRSENLYLYHLGNNTFAIPEYKNNGREYVRGIELLKTFKLESFSVGEYGEKES